MVHISKLRRQRWKFYKGLPHLYCPALKDFVHFTSIGFDHLLYKHSRVPRGISEQYLKLLYLIYAPEVVQKCPAVSKVRSGRARVKGKWKEIKWYELVQNVNGVGEVGVIVRRIGGGKYTFASVMPKGKSKKRL